MKITLYTLPIAGAAPLAIPATQPSRRVEIIEDDSAPNQGLVATYPQDKFVQQFNIAPAHEPIMLGNLVSNNNNRGPWVGLPIQKDRSGTVTLRPADILVKLTSLTATATKVRVTEYD